MIKQYWLPAVLGLQLLLIIGSFWYLQNRLVIHEQVIAGQGNALLQVINFLNATSTKQ